ncbi:MAG: glycoside hydrolase family 3 N-terminal domain-containing protein [Candidatus Neomarinimicrobiota bacterium]|nr:glycoside hydrolase family 3 N-terminal domain-containing protein [Candidatus Neomarinimicrobiota bacterium]MED5248293.1 glycoside hydrolase family 3 N-terminal domain-containing protein [Candidatus Neomarinimicrobiota bacterium]
MKNISSNVSELIGQMIMVGIKGHDIAAAKDFFKLNQGYQIGGIILYDEDITISPPSLHNIRSPKQLQKFTSDLQRLSDIPLLVGVDQEGGKVNRLKTKYGFEPSTSWENLGKINDLEQTAKEALRTAKTLKENGINLNFAPVLDLLLSKDNIIIKKQRSFSSNPDKLTNHAKIVIDTHMDNNIIAVAKHFPGQGSSIGDTHEGWVDVSESWSEKELLPYQNLIDSKTISAIMTSHLFNKYLDDEYPATLSKSILTDLLRKKMNFTGVVISDDPQMKALKNKYSLEQIIELMINAGVDIFCFGNNLEYDPDIVKKIHHIIDDLLKRNKITISRLVKSYDRIINLKTMIGLQ